MTEFEQQVTDALDSVPHADDCGFVPGFPGRMHECTCDHRERVAARVAAAIRAACTIYDDSRYSEKLGEEAGLAVLRGTT